MKLFKDLREQYGNMILEDRIDFLKQQHKDKLSTDHDTLAKIKDSDKIIDHFSKKADPTTSKNYTQWLIGQYKGQKIRQEDAPQLKSTLSDFEKVKNNLEKKDINQYKDVGELRDAVATQKGSVEKASKEKAASAERKGVDLKKMYDADGVEGFQIPNKESSVRNYGPGGKQGATTWCTAANSDSNMFNHYKGGKYTMHFPNGEKLQFHHQSGQVKDKNDVEIKEGDPRFAPYEKHISNFIKQTEPLEKGESDISNRFKTYEPDEVEQHLSAHEKFLEDNKDASWRTSPHEKTVNDIAKKAPLSDDQFKRLRELKSDDNWRDSPKQHMYQNPNLTDSQVSTIIGDKHERNRTNPIATLAKNPSTKGENLDKISDEVLKYSENHDLNNLANNPNLEDRHITRIMKERPEFKRHLALNNNIKFSPETQKDYINSGNKIDVYDSDLSHLSQRPDLSPESINHIANSTDRHAVRHLISNPDVQLSKDHIDSILKNHDAEGDASKQLFHSHHEEANNRSSELFDNMLDAPKQSIIGGTSNSKMFNKEHLAKLIEKGDAPDKSVANLHVEASKSNKLSSDQIHHLIDKTGGNETSGVIDNLLKNNKLKPEHLQKIVNTVKLPEWKKQSVLDHPAANAQVLHDTYDKGTTHDKTSVLHHPAVQTSHFAKALAEPGFKLHGAISSAPGAPPSALNKMAESPLSFVRQNVASHKNTPQETLKDLKSDSNEQVAAAAAKRYKGQ